MRLALIRRRVMLVSAVGVSSACGLSAVGTGPEDAGAPPSSTSFDASTASVDAAPLADGSADAATCLPSPAGLVSSWDGEGNMSDATGANSGAAGTQNGASGMAYASGEVGQAFDLGAKSYVRVPSSASLNLTTAASMEAWIFATALGGRVVDKNTAGGSDGYMLDTYKSKVRLIIGGVGLSSTSTLPTNQWVHVAGTWDGSVMKVYANGVLVGTGGATKLPSNTLDVRIGADSSGANHFSGRLDEVAVYSRALTQSEIADIYAAGTRGRCH